MGRHEAGALVLVGHGDDHTRARVSRALKHDGHQVEVVGDGLALLDWLADGLMGEAVTRPDLIVAQLDLPGRRGLDLLGDLRAVGWSVPFILLSPRGKYPAVGRRLPSVVVFDEPFDVDDLRTAVVFMLGTRWQGPKRIDRRASPRIRLELWAEEYLDHELSHVQVHDISTDGLKLCHGYPRETGGIISLRLRLPGDRHPIDVMGEVMNSRPRTRDYHVGIRFIGMDDSDRMQIDRFISRHGQPPSALAYDSQRV